MECYVKEELNGMFLITGEGMFTGEEDILLGQQFVETILNEGFHVACQYGKTDDGQDAMLIKFTTEPNSVLIG